MFCGFQQYLYEPALQDDRRWMGEVRDQSRAHSHARHSHALMMPIAGDPPLDCDRQRGHSLGELARSYRISRTTVYRVLHEHVPTLEQSA